ncbi:MAG: hypothetical protein HRF43_18460 [Phycisphaerae bacterium]|jgi:hypothetical protein
MREQDLRELVDAEKFTPFVLHVSDGSKYVIRNRADVLTTRSVVYIGVDPDENGVPRRTVRVDPVHITRMTPLKTNGARKRK